MPAGRTSKPEFTLRTVLFMCSSPDINGGGGREFVRRGACDSPLAVSSRAVWAYDGIDGGVTSVELDLGDISNSIRSYSGESRGTGQ